MKSRWARWPAKLSTTLLTGLAAVVLSPLPAVAGSVSGRVTTVNGVGIGGIDIDVIVAATGVSLPLVDDDTDGDGTFDFTVPDGRYLVRFEADPALPLVSRSFNHWALIGHRAWDVTLEVGVSLSGHVFDDAGTPVAGAEISVFDPETGLGVHIPEDATNASGQYQGTVPSGGRYRVRVEPPAGSDLLALEFETPLAEGVLALPDVTLQQGFRVTGRVLAEGTPVARADLNALDASGTSIPLGDDNTAADGRFSIVVPGGPTTLVVRPRPYSGLAPTRSGLLQIGGDTEVGDLTVDAGVTLEGTVLAPDSRVAPGVDVEALTGGGDAVDVVSIGTNEDGEYIACLAPGTYTIRFAPPPVLEAAALLVSGVSLSTDQRLDAQLDVRTPVEGLSVLAWSPTPGEVTVQWTVRDPNTFAGFRLLGGLQNAAPLHDGLLRPDVFLPEGYTVVHGPATDQYTARLVDAAPTHVWVEAVWRTGERDREGPVATGVIAPAAPAMSIAPNPLRAGTVIRLAASVTGIAPRLAVFDVRGRRVDRGLRAVNEGRSWVWRLDSGFVESLVPGIYFIRATTGEGVTVVRKVVRAR